MPLYIYITMISHRRSLRDTLQLRAPDTLENNRYYLVFGAFSASIYCLTQSYYFPSVTCCITISSSTAQIGPKCCLNSINWVEACENGIVARISTAWLRLEGLTFLFPNFHMFPFIVTSRCFLVFLEPPPPKVGTLGSNRRLEGYAQTRTAFKP